MALTIRMTDEQRELVGRVQGMMGEAAHSRTLLRAVAEYEKLTAANEQLRQRVAELEDWLGTVREARRTRAEALAEAERAGDELAELERRAEEELGLSRRRARDRGYGRGARAGRSTA